MRRRPTSHQLSPFALGFIELSSLWRDYPGTVVVTLGVLLLQASLIVALLLRQRARRRSEITLLAVEDQRRELFHLGRVAMLGEMSGALAHDLRQPLLAIRSYVQGSRRLLANDRVDLAKLQEGFEGILKAEQHAGAVIDRTCALLKRNDPRLEDLDINDIIHDTLGLAWVEFENRAVVATTRLASGLPTVLGDRIEIQQVLMNMILNACDAMNGLAETRRRLEIVSSYHEEEERIQIRVRDAGTGIPPDHLPRIFDPFVTTKQDGLGLGLPICRSIVRSLGGDIKASNNTEGGATFVISLPAGARQQKRETPLLDEASEVH